MSTEAPNTPWEFDPTTGCIDGTDGSPVAYVSASVPREVGCLISAAPELLDCLEWFVGWCDAGTPGLDRARKAIAKATGRPTEAAP